jgi:tryptophan synthase alpha chain
MGGVAGAFDHGKAFIGYITGGDPSLRATKEFAVAMRDAGCDLLEIGAPCANPSMDGPVIRDANRRALDAGATAGRIFRLVSSLRDVGFTVPIVLLAYAETLRRSGCKAFFAGAGRSGIDGIIIPDLPPGQRRELTSLASERGVDLISVISSKGGDEIETIASQATGFIYLTSSSGVTGMRRRISTDLAPVVNRVKAVTDIPVAVGFGVHSPSQARRLAKIADGVIVGSAIVKLIEERGADAAPSIADYVRKMKAAVTTI